MRLADLRGAQTVIKTENQAGPAFIKEQSDLEKTFNHRIVHQAQAVGRPLVFNFDAQFHATNSKAIALLNSRALNGVSPKEKKITVTQDLFLVDYITDIVTSKQGVEYVRPGYQQSLKTKVWKHFTNKNIPRNITENKVV